MAEPEGQERPAAGATRIGREENPDGAEAVLEDRFKDLNLHGEEEEDLDLSGEIESLIEET